MAAGMSTRNGQQGGMALIGDVNQVKAAKDNQYAAYTFDYDSCPGFLVPVHIALNKLGARPRQNDNRNSVPNHELQAAIPHRKPLLQPIWT